MLKGILIIFYLVILHTFSYSQQVDYNKIIIPEDITVDDFSERLVQLAWKNHPANKMVIRDREIAQISLTQQKWSWLNQISATGNLNEFTVNPDPGNNILFPRYNFGVSVPLGIFLNTPTNTKIARNELEKADLAIKQQKLILRNQVLKAYQNYLMYEQIYRLKSDLTEDEYANFLTVEEKFQDGSVSLEDYKMASKVYVSEMEAQIMAKNQLENAKLEIELLIGINLEEIL